MQGFQDYKEAPDVKAYRKSLGLEEEPDLLRATKPSVIEKAHAKGTRSFAQLCMAKEPVAFISKLANPYLNLAIEDYIYNKMPLPADGNCNRLMFYVNDPCVVIGKNQNPWKEVNLPLLNDLGIPLVRRRSGGGTVVHDTGNVNYSFMTTKEKFDRHTFAELVTRSVNSIAPDDKAIKVTERGDIVTKEGNLKVSGSAYKLSKGKSYHHGTMLLNLRLDILRQLLHRDESRLGTVNSSAAVNSVRSPVTNLGLANDEFVSAVCKEFEQEHGKVQESEPVEEEFDQTELLGLDGFVQAFSPRTCEVATITSDTQLPQEILKVKLELESWEWKFAATPKFTHVLRSDRGFTVTFGVKKGLVDSLELVDASDDDREHFRFLELVLARGDEVRYTGSTIAGFVLDDELSEWIGLAIDGTT